MSIVEGFMQACDTTPTTKTVSWSRRGRPVAAFHERGQEYMNGKKPTAFQGK